MTDSKQTSQISAPRGCDEPAGFISASIPIRIARLAVALMALLVIAAVSPSSYAQSHSATHLTCGYYVVYGPDGTAAPLDATLKLFSAGDLIRAAAEQMHTPQGKPLPWVPEGTCSGPLCKSSPQHPANHPGNQATTPIVRSSAILFRYLFDTADAFGQLLLVIDEPAFSSRRFAPPDPPPWNAA